MSTELKRAVAVILAGMLVFTVALAVLNIWYTRQAVDSLRLEYAARAGSLESNLALLGSQLKESREDNLLAGYYCELENLSKEEKQVSYVLRMIPKVYEKGTSISFLYQADDQAQRRAIGVREATGNEFSTVIVVPQGTDHLEVYVAMEKDGVIRTQLAESRYGLAEEYSTGESSSTPS